MKSKTVRTSQRALTTGYQKKKILAIVAHPDDEILGCGGTIAKVVSLGSKVKVLLPFKRNDSRGRKNWSYLVKAFTKSCSYLGADPVVPKRLLNEVKATTHIDQCHNLILPYIDWADLILTHWSEDVNQVHQGLSRAVEVATRPFRRKKDVFLFEIPTSTDQTFCRPFTPNCFFILDTQHVKKKLAALLFYDRETALGRTPENIRKKMQVRGAQIGVKYAEAFFIARKFE